MKTGLVIEGGAMRGMFDCGVVDVLMENKIEFDAAVGVSAGACFCCNIKSGQIGRGIRYNKRFCTDKRYFGVGNLLREGNIFAEKFCFETIPFELDVWDHKAFAENPMEFYCVCTDVETGKPYYHKCNEGLGEDIKYIQASSSMPMVSKIVKIGNHGYLDGGVSDSIPVRFFEEKGFERIVVLLTQPLDYVKKKNKMIPLMRLMYPEYPHLVDAMARRHEMYNETYAHINSMLKEGRLFVIAPDESLNIPHMTRKPEELERVYQTGRKKAQDILPQLISYLDK